MPSEPEPRKSSPYARALGERAAQLHPILQRYFASLPAGSVGVGTGTFDRVGSPRRWLRPFLAPLQRAGIVHSGWELDVPFQVINSLDGGRAASERRFAFSGGTWIMRDAVGLNRSGRLVDELGPSRTVVASFDLAVRDGGLLLRSRSVGIRVGRRLLRIPRAISPVVRLHERFDDALEMQRVDATIDVPVIGRVYEYGGTFEYRIEERA